MFVSVKGVFMKKMIGVVALLSSFYCQAKLVYIKELKNETGEVVSVTSTEGSKIGRKGEMTAAAMAGKTEKMNLPIPWTKGDKVTDPKVYLTVSIGNKIYK